MNFISKKYKNIILIFIILVLIYCSYKESLFEKLKKIFKICYEPFICDNKTGKNLIDVNLEKSNTPTFFNQSQKDFGYHSENLKSSEAEELDVFLQSLVMPNHNQYDLTSSSTKKFKSTIDGEKILLQFLTQKLDKKIKNIKLEDKIYYFKNHVCLEIQPFQISGDYIIDNNSKSKKNHGKVKVQLELAFKFDQPNDIFMSQSVFNKYSGIFKINRAILINHKTIDTKETKKILPIRLENPLTYSKYNFTYDKQETGGLDTINSLIPEDIEITESEYEKDSENITSQKVRL